MRDKTLQELDGEDWGEPDFDSYVVTNCHRLRHVPLKDFTVEDLRLVIGQKFSLEYLVPLALDRLEIDPLAEGAYFEGDLLMNVHRLPQDFWTAHPDLHGRWLKIAGKPEARTVIEANSPAPYHRHL